MLFCDVASAFWFLFLRERSEQRHESVMVVLVDTREQLAVTFPKAVKVRRVTLPFGDYAAETDAGQRFPVVWERKSLPDLFSTMTSNYPRFKMELLAAQEANVQLLLGIEGTLTDVLEGVPYSDFAGESCVRKVMTLWVRYGLRPVFCCNRRELAQQIVGLFAAIERGYQ